MLAYGPGLERKLYGMSSMTALHDHVLELHFNSTLPIQVGTGDLLADAPLALSSLGNIIAMTFTIGQMIKTLRKEGHWCQLGSWL